MSSTLPPLLIAASAAIMLVLGLLHLRYTFHGAALLPRDRALRARMEEVALVITRETTVWKAWIGFNASHAFGLIFFGAAYGYLALMHGAFLFQSWFLLALGLLLLGVYTLLARRYWFSVPFGGAVASAALYLAALVIALARTS